MINMSYRIFLDPNIRKCIFTTYSVLHTKSVPIQSYLKSSPKMCFYPILFLQNGGHIEFGNTLKCKMYKPHTFSQIWAESVS